MKTVFNGSFGLFEVDKIIIKENFREITFKNDKRSFFGCYLNCFISEDYKNKSLIELKSGDKIWIDISAHTADKSLFVHKPILNHNYKS